MAKEITTTMTVAAALGRRRDWIRRPIVRLTFHGFSGPIVVIGSLAVSWIPFASMPVSPQSDPLGLYVGAASIVLMAWSFVLSVRLSVIESMFGGLDRAYTWHRWIGIISIGAMWFHIQQNNEVLGIPGASIALAEVGTSFAGFAEIVFYVLIVMSILRWVPYRWWRSTHKLLGIPFLFACFHFITAEKPYDNVSPWGAWFAIIMAAGTVAWVARVFIRDAVRRGIPHSISSIVVTDSVTDVVLNPRGGRPLRRRVGQFAFLKVQQPGLSEPHPFSIASAPHDDALRFVMKSRGDWTTDVRTQLGIGATVLVEGPYGRLKLFPRGDKPVVWFAGGLGITPFLSAIAELSHERPRVPHVFYSVSSIADGMAVDDLRAAFEAGHIVLHLHVSAEGNRLSDTHLKAVFGSDGLKGAHIVMCGPDEYVTAVQSWVSALGGGAAERESFDIRSGLGPDLSVQLQAFVGKFAWVRRLQNSRSWLSRS
ncbi:MAG: ferric reductase-like transmembrane domain-containing protein [Microbacteriaceae bacterium]